MTSEDALATLPVAALVPALVATLSEGCNATPLGAEPPLLAARALTYLADGLPQAAGTLLSDPRSGCLAPVTATLRAPECIDLAEQCIALLDKVAATHPRAVLKAGGLTAALACIDFYATGVARTAARVAANAARALGNGARSGAAASASAAAAAAAGRSARSAAASSPSSSEEKSDAALAAEAVPALAGLLHSQDPRIVEAGCSALCRAAAALGDGKRGADADGPADVNGETNHARALSQAGLVQACVALLRVRDEDGGPAAPGMAPGTYFAVLRLLTSLSATRADAAVAALEAGAAPVLKALLSTSPLLSTAVVESSDSFSSSSTSKPAALLRSGDQLAVALSAVASLLPPLADAAAVVASGAPASSLAKGEDGSSSPAASARSAWLSAHPTVAAAATAGLLGLLVAAYDGGGAASSPAARALCVDVVSRAVAASPAQALRQAIDDVPASSFVAAMLRARDASAVASGVRLAELLQEKLPEVTAVFFPKEGVLAGLRKLAVGEGLLASDAAAAGANATTSAVPPRLSRASARLRERQRTVSSSGFDEPSSAAAAAPSPPPSSSSSSSLRSAAAARAALFLASRFPSAAASGDADTDAARALRAAAEALPKDGPSKLFELVGGGASVPGGRVSAHEILSARVPAALRSYLAGEDLLSDGGEGDSPPPSTAAAEALLSRALGFLNAGEVETPTATAAAGGLPSSSSFSRLRALVRVLHEALNASDRFALAASSSAAVGGERASGDGSGGSGAGGSPSARSAAAAAAQRFGSSSSSSASASLTFGTAPPGTAGSLGAGLAQLSQPLRLRLTVAPSVNAATAAAVTTAAAGGGGETTTSSRRRLRDAGAAVVLVEPLATLSAVEDFLWPRVAPPELPASGGGGGTGSSAAARRATATPAAAAAAPRPNNSARRSGGPSGGGGGSGDASAAATAAAAIPGRSTGAAAAGGDGSGTAAEQRMTRAAAAAGAGRRRGRAAGDVAAGDEDEEMADTRGSQDEEDSDGALFDGGGCGGEAGRGEGDESDSDDDDEEGSPREGDEAGFAFDDDEDGFDAWRHGGEDEEDDEDDYDDGGGDDGDDDEAGMMEDDEGYAGYRAAGGGGGRGSRGGGGGGPSSNAAASRSDAAAASAARPRLRFRVDGVAVPSDATVFQALNAAAAAKEEAEALGEGGGGGGGASGSVPSSSSGGGGVSARRRLWHDVHTITYELFDGGEEAEEGGGEGEGAAMAVDVAAATASAPDAAATTANANNASSNPTAVAAAASRWARAEPALPPELVFAAAAARNGLVVSSAASTPSASSSSSCLLPSRAAFFKLSDDGADVLAVLKALHALNAARPRLAAAAALREGKPPPADLPRPPLRPGDFVNPRLAPRLALQLKDVLAVAGGCLPPWVAALASGARFVFPGPLRARYVRLTCFGLPRALMHMASVNAAEAAAASGSHGGGGGGGNNGGGGGGGGAGDNGTDSSAADDARVARVARQRVRVDRNHVLDAAGRVLAAHAGGRPLLEFEFAGEPGTGLGPTLEFYTLACAELQGPGLGMWRGDAAAPSAGGKPSSKGLPLPGEAAASGAGGGGGGTAAAAATRPRLATSASSSVVAPESAAAPPPPPPAIDAPLGLFPAPLPPKGGGPGVERALSRFRTLGRLAGRGLRDGRLLDLRVARPFWAVVTGASLTLADLRAVDEHLSRSLEALEGAAVAAEKEEEEESEGEEDDEMKEVEEGGGGGGAAAEGGNDDDKGKRKKKKKKKAAVLVGGCPLEDLGLTWELPGFPSFRLKSSSSGNGGGRRSSEGGNSRRSSEGGNNRRSSSGGGGSSAKPSSSSPRHGSAITDAATLRRYVAACVDATVGSGVARAVEAFRAGFADAAPLSCLCPFGAAEVDELICGEGVGGGSSEEESWSRAALVAAVRFDHGYTAASPSAAAFLDALASLEPKDRRAFVAWATGCPRLPPGGLAALTPRLTVVRKAPTTTAAAAVGSGAAAGAGGGGDMVAGSLGGAALMTTSGSIGNNVNNNASSSAPAFPGAFATAADADLPSVMTCANYVKLPPYSSAAAAKARLLVAIREGGGSFDLS